MQKKKQFRHTLQSSVRTLSVKCYDEQLVFGFKGTTERIRKLPKTWQVLAIAHNRDYGHDDIWEPSFEKVHYHFIVRFTERSPKRISTILNALGIQFRPGTDDTLWNNHGIETVADFGSMAVYLTHETKQAELDGKVKYELTEIISNLSIEEIKQIREGYFRLSSATQKVGFDDMAKLDELAYQAGYELQDFNSWYQALPFAVRCNAKMKVIEKSFYFGAEAKANEHEDLNRLCIFIQGSPNTGKSYAASHAMAGKRVLHVSGGGSGKFDKLSPATEVIIVDDDIAGNLLNMTDNYMCQAYKRGSNNPYWCGQYYIVTSNLTFRQWLEDCGIRTQRYTGSATVDSTHYQAMLSRFYVCHIQDVGGINQLVCDTPSTRGNYDTQMERKTKFQEFREHFNAIIGKYVPKSLTVDYSDLNA